MQISGPTPVSVTAAPVTMQSAPIRHVQIFLDLSLIRIVYCDDRIVTGAIGAALLTAIENRVKAVIENDQGWAAGTSTLA